jgi:serine/threonine protein kinase
MSKIESMRIIYDLSSSCENSVILGQGGQGTVKVCNKPIKPITFVVKESRGGEDASLVGELLYYNDTDIDKKYDFVLQMFPVLSFIDTTNYTIDKKKIAMPRMDMTLSTFIYNKLYNEYTFEERYDVMNSLITVVKGLNNSNKYSHNDIKPENIGINVTTKDRKRYFEVKLLDMGTCSKIDKIKPIRPMTGINVNMTFYYASPRTWHNEQQDYKRDQWALGCTIYEMFAKTRMFTIGEKSIEMSVIAQILQMNTELLNLMLNKGEYKKIDEIHIVENNPKKVLQQDLILATQQQFVNQMKEINEIAPEEAIKTIIFDLMSPSLEQNQVGGKHHRSKPMRGNAGNAGNTENTGFEFVSEDKNGEIRIIDVERFHHYCRSLKKPQQGQGRINNDSIKPHKTSNTSYVTKNGKMCVRKNISEAQYYKEKGKEGHNVTQSSVSRYIKRKNNEYVYYLYAPHKKN